MTSESKIIQSIELLNLVKATKPSKLRYVIDELALEHGHEGHAARNNTETPFSTAKMMTLLKTACAEVTTEDWRKVVEKTKNIILQDFERDF
ncbi:Uncharacterized protein OBRU01_10272 [Operophtera brumata]|uniref:Uncharacterized protein n=1 Tax=Operophtera brumata TaxID=104452 RepID=A0A0L7KR79_OPEBR|nr:Uncharacterized protein OBRU01_10272 [Operophtera brumata]